MSEWRERGTTEDTDEDLVDMQAEEFAEEFGQLFAEEFKEFFMVCRVFAEEVDDAVEKF